jgi:hypothetical protein
VTAARQFSTLAASTFLLLAGMTACNRGQNAATEYGDGNPADANLAPVPAGTAPEAAPEGQTGYVPPTYSEGESAPVAYEQQEAQEPPPPLPEYSQPPCPGENYIWTPGYWAYSSGYYWVPGVWVTAPWVGALWTPPWWGFENNVYIWHAGYWGPHIGFYGGIDYGFGYTGRGYYGAYWHDNTVFYNRTVTNVNVSVVRNVYNYSAPNYRPNYISYNGGRGGIEARPTPQELAVARDPRTPAVAAQVQHVRAASGDRAQFAAVNHDRPAALVVAAPLATSYKGPAARPPEAAVRAAARPATQPRPQVQANERPGAPPATEPQRGQAERFTPPPPQPQVRNEPIPRPTPQQRPEVRNEPAPRPAPQQRPEGRNEPAPRPAPQQRPEVRNEPAPRPAPQQRPEVRNEPAPRPAPQKPPEARPAAQPRPEAQRAPERRPKPEEEPKP